MKTMDLSQNHHYSHGCIGLSDVHHKSFSHFARQGLKAHNINAGLVNDDSEIILADQTFGQTDKILIVATEEEIDRNDAWVWYREPSAYNQLGYHIGHNLGLFLKHHSKTIDLLKSGRGILTFSTVMHWGFRPISNAHLIDSKLKHDRFDAGLVVLFGKNVDYDFGLMMGVERGRMDLFEHTSVVCMLGVNYV